MRHLVRSRRYGSLIAAGYHGDNCAAFVCDPDPSQTDWTYDMTKDRTCWNLFEEPYRLASISLCHTGHFLAAMDSGPTGDAFLMIRTIPDPGDFRFSPVHYPITRIGTPQTLWCSSPCPTEEKPIFAIGGSDGLHTLQGEGSFWSLTKKPFPLVGGGRQGGRRSASAFGWRVMDSSHAVVCSVEWTSSNVVASGLRDSAIILNDLRSGGTTTRLQHDRSVERIRSIDPYRLVVSGGSSLRMYDLRYPPNNLQRNPRPYSPNHASTRPYVTFPEYVPGPLVTPRFDISRELNLLASCSDNNKIQLFSLRTGQQLPSPFSSSSSSSSSSSLTEYKYEPLVNCLQFEDSDGDDGGSGTSLLRPKLLVSTSDCVDEWSW